MSSSSISNVTPIVHGKVTASSLTGSSNPVKTGDTFSGLLCSSPSCSEREQTENESCEVDDSDVDHQKSSNHNTSNFESTSNSNSTNDHHHINDVSSRKNHHLMQRKQKRRSSSRRNSIREHMMMNSNGVGSNGTTDSTNTTATISASVVPAAATSSSVRNDAFIDNFSTDLDDNDLFCDTESIEGYQEGGGTGAAAYASSNSATFDASEEIQVEFEARTPERCDSEGIKRLLIKVFGNKKAASNFDLTELVDTIISQRRIGSVITQSRDYATSNNSNSNYVTPEHNGVEAEVSSIAELDESTAIDTTDYQFNEDELCKEIFGLATVIPLNQWAKVEIGEKCDLSQGIIRYITDIACKTQQNLSNIMSVLKKPDKSNNVGLIISERIVNIPPQISVPLYHTLIQEVEKAKKRFRQASSNSSTSSFNPFDFTHYILLSKMLLVDHNNLAASASTLNSLPPSPKKSRKRKNGSEQQQQMCTGQSQISTENTTKVYVNAEEELVENECESIIDMDMHVVREATRSVREGGGSSFLDWNELDDEFEHVWKVFVFKAEKLENIAMKLENAFPL